LKSSRCYHFAIKVKIDGYIQPVQRTRRQCGVKCKGSLAFFALGQPTTVKKQAPTVAKIFYFPFESHPLEAITESNIERDRIFYIQIISAHPRHEAEIPDEHPLLTKLKQMLAQAP